jgi:hypothetical protein
VRQSRGFGFPLYMQRMLKISHAFVMGKVIPKTSYFEYITRLFHFNIAVSLCCVLTLDLERHFHVNIAQR